ncbi:hypothetical protein [Pedobacter cryophilus]|uniref:Uncharacterized protein n=1 Tax=Pedobacter cryophilus TaxID=2571271 RepID=A0A4U1BZ06_9SPHI|nr:hypothetical protein [Pedobacter cryophilus]TKB95737.1 hypothetical protein FA046_15715 [Pedobacter cryophilus]
MSKSKPQRFETFFELYQTLVAPLKKSKPEYIRLDGQIKGSNRGVFGYFKFNNSFWKIDADTQIDKLDLAKKLLLKDNDALIVRPTKNNKNECLVIKGQSVWNKKFYVYKVS